MKKNSWTLTGTLIFLCIITLQQSYAAATHLPTSYSWCPLLNAQPVIYEWPHPGFHLTNGNIDMLISGQLNQDIIYVNDGERQRVFYGDNDVSASTLRFTTTAKTNDDFKIFSIFEMGIEDNSSKNVSQIYPAQSLFINIRIAEVGFDSTCYGRLALGQGYTATDYTAEVDLSGTNLTQSSKIQGMGGGVFFSSSNNGDIDGNPIIKQVFNNLDGYNRRVRLRYDTPVFKGFKFSASTIERSNMDGALRYDNEFESFKLAAAIGLASISEIRELDDIPGKNLDGSISILFKNGLNGTYAGGTVFAQEDGRDNPFYNFFKLGFQFRLNCLGKTNTSIQYGIFKNYNQNGDVGQTYGAAIVQDLNAWNANIYIAANRYHLHRSDEGFNPITLVVAGMVVKF